MLRWGVVCVETRLSRCSPTEAARRNETKQRTQTYERPKYGKTFIYTDRDIGREVTRGVWPAHKHSMSTQQYATTRRKHGPLTDQHHTHSDLGSNMAAPTLGARVARSAQRRVHWRAHALDASRRRHERSAPLNGGYAGRRA